MFSDIEVEIVDGLPVVGMDGFEFLQEAIEDGKTTLSHHFGRAMYFMCEITKEITQLKYAVLESGILVSAKYLRKFHKAKAKEEERIKRLEAKQQRQATKSRTERAEIRDKFNEFKESLKMKLEDLSIKGIAEGKTFLRKGFTEFKDPTPEERQARAVKLQETIKKNQEPERRAIANLESWVNGMGSNVSKFFDREKFELYLQTEAGKAKSKEILGYEYQV